MLLCFYCLSAEIAPPSLSSPHLCIYSQHLRRRFLWSDCPRGALQVFSNKISIFPFTPAACLCMFQSFFFFLHRGDCFGSVPSDVSPAACSTTTSIYWEHPLWLCPRRTHTSFRVHHTVSLAALYPDLPSSTQLFRL